MRVALLSCLALVAACPAGHKDAQEGPTARPGDSHAADQQGDKGGDMDSQPAAVVCADLACLGAHEGEMIELEGTFVFPKEKAFARNKLSLGDGTTVILSQPADETQRGYLSAGNDGKQMKIQGRIFTRDIPEKYRIIGRTPDPYLLDIARVAIAGG